MYYEIYIDVLFLYNFLLDHVLLLLLWKIMSLPSRQIRILAGSFVGALLACIVTIFPCPFPILKLILFHLVVNTVMIKTAYQISNRTQFMEIFVLLYICTFLLDGILRFLETVWNDLFHFKVEQSKTTTNPWMAILTLGGIFIGYYLMKLIFFLIRSFQRSHGCKCKVVLYTSTGTYELQALLDTGNELVDKVSGKAVSVIDKILAEQIFSDKEMMTVRYVPYRTISKSGVMPAVKVSSMIIERQSPKRENGRYTVDEPVIAISENSLSVKGTYQIILNPDILGGMSIC